MLRSRGVSRTGDDIIDPSLDDSRIGDGSRQRLSHEEMVKNDPADASSNPDNLASLSAVAAAAAAASARKQA